MVESSGEIDIKNNAQRKKNQFPYKDKPITWKAFFKSPRKNKTIDLKLMDNKKSTFQYIEYSTLQNVTISKLILCFSLVLKFVTKLFLFPFHGDINI